MDELFGIDAQARQEGLSQIDRHLLRLEKSKPLLEQIKAAIQATRTDALPKSALAKACDYTLTLWSRLSRFLEYPELELSNNLAENSMRPVALGRKNWVHLGSKEAGPRVAAIVSIVETCRRLNLPIRDYLGSVLPGLGRFSVQSKRRTHAQRLGRTKIAVAVNRAVGKTLTKDVANWATARRLELVRIASLLRRFPSTLSLVNGAEFLFVGAPQIEPHRARPFVGRRSACHAPQRPYPFPIGISSPRPSSQAHQRRGLQGIPSLLASRLMSREKLHPAGVSVKRVFIPGWKRASHRTTSSRASAELPT
jgi:Transposase IS66 family